MILLQAVMVIVLRSKKDKLDGDNVEWRETQLKLGGMKSRNIIKRAEHEQCDFNYIVNFKETADEFRRQAIEKI